MIVLVTGGRDYRAAYTVAQALDTIHAETPISLLVHGAARGLDMLAHAWGERVLGWEKVRPFPADWERDGRLAGPIRNSQMLRCARPDLCVKFRGHSGTADMLRKAKLAGVRTIEID
jgi:hypothetical protein